MSKRQAIDYFYTNCNKTKLAYFKLITTSIVYHFLSYGLNSLFHILGISVEGYPSVILAVIDTRVGMSTHSNREL